jgi:hypothetical protein
VQQSSKCVTSFGADQSAAQALSGDIADVDLHRVSARIEISILMAEASANRIASSKLMGGSLAAVSSRRA